MSDRGLYRKYDVKRTDGRDAPGERHHGCRLFVLDLDHDPHACPALSAYADSCAEEHPELARDLRDLLRGRAVDLAELAAWPAEAVEVAPWGVRFDGVIDALGLPGAKQIDAIRGALEPTRRRLEETCRRLTLWRVRLVEGLLERLVEAGWTPDELRLVECQSPVEGDPWTEIRDAAGRVLTRVEWARTLDRARVREVWSGVPTRVAVCDGLRRAVEGSG